MPFSRLALQRLLLVLLISFAFPCMAAASRVKTESGMLVTGSIEISAAGHVLRHTLDQPERLPEAVRKFADSLIPTLRFDPVETPDQKPTRSQMRLYFVAADNGNGGYAIRLRDAWFDSEAPTDTVRSTPGQRLRLNEREISKLPMPMTATVYLALEIGRDSRISRMDVSHVDLGVSGTELHMKLWRRILGDLATDFIQQARFDVPTTGIDAQRDSWTGLYAIPFSIQDEDESTQDNNNYGRWQTFVPGPRKDIPWLDPQATGAGNALLADGFSSGRPHRRLTTLPGG